MGQKVNPISARLGHSATWRSRWFDLKNYRENLLSDYRIRELLERDYKKAAIAKVEIERLSSEVIIKIHTARPGVVIGRGGAGVEELRKKMKKLVDINVKIDVIEVRDPEANAAIIAHNIVEQIEKRIPFRRAIRSALQAAELTDRKSVV